MGKRRRQPLLGSHNRSHIWGRNAVVETLRAGTWPIVELHASDRLEPSLMTWVETCASERGLPLSFETDENLARLCRAADHQGLVALMGPFPYCPLDDLLARRPDQPLYVLLDGLQDSFNLGAVIRGAEVLGADGILLEQTGQAGVNSQVARSSAGAVNHLPIVRVERLPDAARQLQAAGIALVAATEKGSQAPAACDFRRPLALVIGNEGVGIRAELLSLADAQVRIPQSGQVESLNAAVSAGILFYEVHRQRAPSAPAS